MNQQRKMQIQGGMFFRHGRVLLRLLSLLSSGERCAKPKMLLRSSSDTKYHILLYPLSSSISVVHFHSHNKINSTPNYIPHSTNLTPIPHRELKQFLLKRSKSGFDNLDNALVMFDKMLKLRPLPNVIDFNQLLTALVIMKQYPVAVSLFRDMCALSISVDIFTFSIAINCCCHNNQIDYAFSLLGGIFKRGFVPNEVIYTTLIRGLLYEHKSQEARILFTNLIKFGEIHPDVVTFNTVINGLCKTGNTDKALWLFKFMEKSDCKPDTVTYTTIIDSLCKHDLVNDALSLHCKMIKNGVSPTVHTFTILVNAYSKSGKLDDAKRLIEMMNEKGEYPDIFAYNTLMQAYCTQGKMDGALAVVKTITSKEIKPNCFTYNILLDACCKQLKLDMAMDLYRNMACEGLEPTVQTHSILLHGLCGWGKPMEALTFFYKIHDQGHMLDTVIFQTMLSGLCKNQFIDQALSLFHLMRCHGLIPDRDTYNIIIRGCLWNKKYDEACELVDKMVDCGFLADAVTTSLLQHLLLLEAHHPTLRAMQQKCLHSGIHEESYGVDIPKVNHIGCPAEKSIESASYG